MKAKITFVIFILFVNTNTGYSQENYSFMKLLIENDKEEILLVKWDGEWELPGDKFNEAKSISIFLEGIAETVGVGIEDHKLFGLYTQKWRGVNYLTLMHYYKADYVTGDLKIPSDCTDVRWFSKSDALQKIPYDNMKFMIKWLDDNPGKIASTSFERFKDANKKTVYFQKEEWHSLN